MVTISVIFVLESIYQIQPRSAQNRFVYKQYFVFFYKFNVKHQSTPSKRVTHPKQ